MMFLEDRALIEHLVEVAANAMLIEFRLYRTQNCHSNQTCVSTNFHSPAQQKRDDLRLRDLTTSIRFYTITTKFYHGQAIPKQTKFSALQAHQKNPYTYAYILIPYLGVAPLEWR